MNGINFITRPGFAWTYQFLIVIGMTLCNCSLTLARKQDYVPISFFVVMGATNITVILVLYFVLTRVEGLYKESLTLIKSIAQTAGASKEKSAKEKRRKERKLQDRKPKKWIYRMPLAWEIGMFYRMDHGAALDFLQTVVDRTFDAMVLF